MRFQAFALRNLKELIRDPLMAVFNIGFPVVLLLLFSAIQANIPVQLFVITSIAPGIAVFGFSFVSLYAGLLVAQDRCSSFLMRLLASPLTASDYIVGYVVPLFPIAIMQSIICFILAFFLGMPLNINVLFALIVLIPIAFLYISIGLLMGTLFNDKAVGGIASILTNVSAWLSGIWFNLDLVGNAFKTVSYLLPFAHAVDAARAALSGDYAAVLPHLLWVIGYTIVIFFLTVCFFRKKMKS